MSAVREREMTDDQFAEKLAEANSAPGEAIWPHLAPSERAEWINVARTARAILALQGAKLAEAQAPAEGGAA